MLVTINIYFLPILPIYLPVSFDPVVRSKFQIVRRRTYAHSYHVWKFQGSCAYSVEGDSVQDGQTAEITTISPRF